VIKHPERPINTKNNTAPAFGKTKMKSMKNQNNPMYGKSKLQIQEINQYQNLPPSSSIIN